MDIEKRNLYTGVITPLSKIREDLSTIAEILAEVIILTKLQGVETDNKQGKLF